MLSNMRQDSEELRLDKIWRKVACESLKKKKPTTSKKLGLVHTVQMGEVKIEIKIS